MSKDLLFSRPEEVTSVTGFFFDYIGTLTGGLWPIAITFVSFSIIYLSLNEYNPRKAYGAASFVTFVVVTLLVAIGAFQSNALIIAILMVVLAVVINGGNK